MPRDVSAGLVVRPDLTFNGVKVFSATMFAPREQLGETVTAWMAANPQLPVTEFVVTPDQGGGARVVVFSVTPSGAVTPRASFFGDWADIRFGRRTCIS